MGSRDMTHWIKELVMEPCFFFSKPKAKHIKNKGAKDPGYPCVSVIPGLGQGY